MGNPQVMSKMFLPLMLVLFYFIAIRPQKQRQKQIMEMRNSLKVGDKVVTYSGVCGEIIESTEEDFVILCEPDKIKLTFKKWAIRGIETPIEEVDETTPSQDEDKEEVDESVDKVED